VPFGSIGLSLFALDLFLATRAGSAATPGAAIVLADFARGIRYWRIAADLALIGVFGGFFVVPLLALVQSRSAPEHRSRIIAANNIINALFMVIAACVGIVLRLRGLSIPQLFLFTAVVNACVAVYIYTLIPEFLMRFLVFLLVHTIYRVRRRGTENIPDEGAAVLVCNHVSYVDALVISAACRRPIRFVMDHHIFALPVLSFVFRTSHAIPIASAKENAALKERAFDEVAKALTEGELVCIFPEGRLTADGELAAFRPGIEHIVRRTPVPVVPLALRGLWGSYFSRKDGAAMRRPFRRVWSRIELVCGPPLPPDGVTAPMLAERVLALRGDAR
jgi:1-acyl-sn-glycerol-3-phosphate acyltransferase